MRSRKGVLILVRHARTIQDPRSPSGEWRLHEGETGACRSLAQALGPLEPNRVITSGQQKAVETGRLLAAELGLPSEAVPGLQEHDRTGVEYDQDERSWLAKLRRLFDEPQERVLGRETAREALDRFDEAVRREVSAHPGETLVLVSHATVMSLFVERYNEVSALDFWQGLAMPDAVTLRLPGFGLLNRIRPAG